MDKSRKFAALLFINIILLICCGKAGAQIDDETEGMYVEQPKIFSVGLLAGANFCQVDGDSYAGYYKAGANFGGIGYARIHKHAALSFELLYSEKGARSSGVRYLADSVTQVLKYGIDLKYAEIPLMLNYFDKHKSHFGMGVSYGRLLSSAEHMTSQPTSTLDFTKYPFKKESYELIAGAQMRIWKGLFFNIRFQYALTPIRTYSPVGYSRSQKQYNNIWVVRVMYLFI